MHNKDTLINAWILSIIALITLMVVVGGLTRLTGSGLSMVDWRPILGIWPPLNPTEWQEVFNLYKTSPQYILVNKGMSLAEFKFIFYWEYGHRVLGRVLGLWFFLPYLYFVSRGWLDKRSSGLLLLAGILGGAQGLLGWYMVKSGLVNEPSVSPYRLAAHLGLALFLLCYLLWIYLSRSTVQLAYKKSYSIATKAILSLVVIQIFYGALMSGFKAGLFYNTFPTMNGDWIPPYLLLHESLWSNLLANQVMIQFIHRWLGVVVVLSLWGLWWYTRHVPLRGIQSAARTLLPIIATAQLGLGICALLLRVPVWAGSLHQIGALITLVVMVCYAHAFSRRTKISA